MRMCNRVIERTQFGVQSVGGIKPLYIRKQGVAARGPCSFVIVSCSIKFHHQDENVEEVIDVMQMRSSV